MKFLTILFLKSLLLSNSLMAETLPIKSKFLKQSSECFKNFQSQVCIEIVSKIEIIIFYYCVFSFIQEIIINDLFKRNKYD